MTRRTDAQTVLAIAAAAVTIALTAAAFWLSYEHLHDTAAQHGLHDQARAWVWPATVDGFIIVGEILVLRASLAHRVDPVAIALTAVGSLGSIVLNVVGTGAHLPRLDYVVSAIPPSAALLAFGALMRQLHAYLTAPDAVPALPGPGYTAPLTNWQPWQGLYPLQPAAGPRHARTGANGAAVPAPVPGAYPPADQGGLPTAIDLLAGNLRPANGAVPAARTRVHATLPYVPEDDPIEPDPDPDPAAATSDEVLAEQLRASFAELLGQGRVPAIRAIRSELGIGQARAQRLQRLLADGAGQ
ncbi:DUF2637 domain-containing protein [Streptacidiphilus sp. EB103A]|uniref:DUF2637 domain-containing protein n=1 Tax=Streptacidiphilus sp. EB103A TaxID=3156275 RepID=UPI00351449B7